MSLGLLRSMPVALALTVAGACASPSTPDAGAADAAPRADAAAPADARVLEPDAALAADGGAPAPDAADPDAAPLADAEAPGEDAGPTDGGVQPCGPVARVDGPARFTEALGAWVARCNPELTPNEARSISTFVAYVAAPAFESAALTYDATAAGQCGCAIAAAPCDRLAWLRAIDACDATFVSTTTTGDACSTDFDCPTRHHCAERQKDLALVAPLSCGRGVCERFAGRGEACSDVVGCAPGTYCDYDQVPSVCAPNAAVGEDCASRPCVGDVDQVLVLPPNQCSFTKAGATCLARGRRGGTCDLVECHALYRCDNNLDCQPIPGEGEACSIPFSPNPGLIERELIIHEASFACRGNIGVGIGAGTHCTITSSVTGAAVCRPRPSVGQACGLGVGRVPFCTPDAFCPGNTPTFDPYTSVCVPRGTETSTCGGRPYSTFTPNQECAPGLTCTYDVTTQESHCLDECGG